MAKVTLSPLISSLSGTIGDMTFRTRNGQTSVFQKNPPRLPANATRKQKAKYKKQLIVNQCIKILQEEIEDILVAISRRQAIKKKVEYWYDKLAPKIKAKTKLQKAIIDACKDTGNVSRLDRESLENGSEKLEKSRSAIGSHRLTAPRSLKRPMPPLSPKTRAKFLGTPNEKNRTQREVK